MLSDLPLKMHGARFITTFRAAHSAVSVLLNALLSAGLELNEENLELLEEVSDFNLEARYPDNNFSFHKKCTVVFTEKKLQQIERLKKWLIQKLLSSI